MSWLTRFLLLFSCALAGLTSSCRSAAPKQAEAARERVAAGDLEGAIEALDVPKNAESPKAQFEIGALHARIAQSARDPERVRVAKEAAVLRWERVLELEPGHVPSLQNLSVYYVELGREEEALERIAEAEEGLEPDAPRRFTLSMIRADAQFRMGELAMCKAELEAALSRWPTEQEPAARRLTLAESFGEEQVVEQARRFAIPAAGPPRRPEFPDVARRGFEGVIRSSVPGVRANMLLGDWLELEARVDALWEGSLDNLPPRSSWGDGAQGAAYDEIQNLLMVSGGEPFAPFEYWTETLLRRHQLATAIHALGEQHELAEAPRAAARFYEFGLNPEIAPSNDDYLVEAELAGRENVRLDLILQLLVVYHTYPEVVEQDHERLIAMVDAEWPTEESFARERGLYTEEERVKFHSTLGLIYADRGLWTRDDWHAAPLHLATAAELAEATGEPRPDLWVTLGNGLRDTGVPLDAHVAYDRAAVIYLANGSRRKAHRTLEAATNMTRSYEDQGDLALIELEDKLYPPEGWYAGLMVGHASPRESGKDFERELEQEGYDAQVSLDTDGFAGKVFGGYRFHRHWAAELSAISLGNSSSEIQGPGGSEFEDEVKGRHPLTGQGIGVAVMLRLYERRRFHAFGKLGYWWWNAEFETNIDDVLSTEEVDGSDVFFGFGVQYDFGPQFGLRAEAERYEISGDETDLFSIGISVDF